MTTTAASPAAPPPSDVGAATGWVGFATLVLLVLVAREWPVIAPVFGVAAPSGALSGPFAALGAMAGVGFAMAGWAVLVEQVHRNPSTGIEWTRRNPPDPRTSWTKIAGLWSTFAVLGALYCLLRWYWSGDYGFALRVLALAGAAMALLAVPYVLWLDRVLVEPRDAAWHWGALLTRQGEWQREQVLRHWRAWLIKGFFGAFMLSILPASWAAAVGADLSQASGDPIAFGLAAIAFLFLVDVAIGTVGYIVTFRPLDAHIRSGNPHLAGWIAALACYPPFAAAILGSGMVLNYEFHTPGWTHWFGASAMLGWVWAGWLVLLTGIYAWATLAFGLRFSNLTYRGIVTNGPYRYCRHPAYLAKNLFWWSAVLPFLTAGGGWSDPVRNCFALLGVNALYYWRARTEETHLLAEDAKYRAYHAWMAEHGAITAPLERIRRRLQKLYL